jgi:ElaB/YqjD/DUF883 family membrane-anchored ribosome-binding protein
MSDFESDTAAKTDRISDDLATLKQDMAALIKQVKDMAVQTGSRLGQDAADKISGHAADLYGTVSEKSRKSAEAVTAHVEEQPLSSLLIAFAAGFIFSKIISR